MKLGARISLAAIILAAFGCGGAGEAPQDVAEQFWTAARDGDAETVERLSIESDNTNLNLDQGDEVGSITFGQTTIEDGTAAVETVIEGDANGTPMEVSFETVLVQRDGEWRVDLDQTTGRMFQAMLGVSMEQMGEAMAEGMKDAMSEMAEGMSDAMVEMGEAMTEAMDEAMSQVENGGKDR